MCWPSPENCENRCAYALRTVVGMTNGAYGFGARGGSSASPVAVVALWVRGTSGDRARVDANERGDMERTCALTEEGSLLAGVEAVVAGTGVMVAVFFPPAASGMGPSPISMVLEAKPSTAVVTMTGEGSWLLPCFSLSLSAPDSSSTSAVTLHGDRERECVCVCVCVCETERGGRGGGAREVYERERCMRERGA